MKENDLRIYEKAMEYVEREVIKRFDEKRKEGVLSRAHDIDHVKAVAEYASLLAGYFSGELNLPDEEAEKNKLLAGIAGWLHDIEREAKETEPHGIKGYRTLQKLYGEAKEISTLPKDEFEIILNAVKDHEKPLSEVKEIYNGSPSLPVVQALIVADKLFEASGPRVLERRAFFVGRERMFKDLKGVFKYPEESYLAVLGETIRRLYHINHVANYGEGMLKPFADILHATQYEFYRGLLLKAGMDEVEAARYLKRKDFPKIERAASVLEKERHLSNPEFFDGYPNIRKAVSENFEEEMRKEAAYRLVDVFARSQSPDEAIEKYSKGYRETNYWFRKWMDGVLDYRSGKLSKKLLKILG